MDIPKYRVGINVTHELGLRLLFSDFVRGFLVIFALSPSFPNTFLVKYFCKYSKYVVFSLVYFTIDAGYKVKLLFIKLLVRRTKIVGLIINHKQILKQI